MSTPNELQRYTLDCGSAYGPDEQGELVLWSDIEPLIRSHEALVKALADAVEYGTNMPQDIQDKGLAALAAAKEVAQPTRAARE